MADLTFFVTSIKDGKVEKHPSGWVSTSEAVEFGNWLVKSEMADFYRVDDGGGREKIVTDLTKIYNLELYECGFCPFRGLVGVGADWTHCPGCGAL